MKFTGKERRDINEPVRQCALSRTRRSDAELLRFVIDPDGRVVPDIKRKLPGRGVWLTATCDVVEKAVRQKVFSRAFKQDVSADPKLAETVGALLRQAALQALAMANKAGDAVSGYAKAEKALKDGQAQCLVHASDASDDGSRKLDKLAIALSKSQTERIARVACFSSAELSAALGKWNVNHAVIADRGAGRTFLRAVERYISYMGPHPATGTMADTPEQEKA